jgi:hypothetical protein
MSLNSLARSYTSLGRAILRFPQAPWDDALSHGQLQSKAWAVNELVKVKKYLGLVYVLGGWLGTLPLLMFESPLRFNKIRSFDIDPNCEPIADQVNVEHVITDWRFKAVTMDMYNIQYAEHRYSIPLPGRSPASQVETCDTVINTCCDHLSQFRRWWSLIPAGKLVLLQNNNFLDVPDHVNTVAQVDDLLAQAPMSKVLFQGELPLTKYTRFMVIGLK